jgi:transposase InsO family protein
MKAGDVTATLEDALAASGCDSATVAHKPRLLSDNGASYISGDLARMARRKGMDHVRGAPNHPQTQGKIERWHQTLKNRILLENYYLPGALEEAIAAPSSSTTTPALPREPRKPHTGRRLLRQGRDHPQKAKGDQRTDHRKAPLAASPDSGINCNSNEPEPPLVIRPACSKSSDDGHYLR